MSRAGRQGDQSNIKEAEGGPRGHEITEKARQRSRSKQSPGHQEERAGGLGHPTGDSSEEVLASTGSGMVVIVLARVKANF